MRQCFTSSIHIHSSSVSKRRQRRHALNILITRKEKKKKYSLVIFIKEPFKKTNFSIYSWPWPSCSKGSVSSSCWQKSYTGTVEKGVWENPALVMREVLAWCEQQIHSNAEMLPKSFPYIRNRRQYFLLHLIGGKGRLDALPGMLHSLRSSQP